MAARSDQRLLLTLAVLAPALVLAAALGGAGAEVLMALPALGFFLPLLAGRYVGEERLARLAAVVRARRAVRRAPAAVAGAAARLRPAVVLPRGGRLIAASLAVRPPPTGAPATT